MFYELLSFGAAIYTPWRKDLFAFDREARKHHKVSTNS